MATGISTPSIVVEKPISCSPCTVQGNVQFGKGCVIHPSASIIAENESSIVFGDFNIIEERVVIVNKGKMKEGKLEPSVIEIGSYNLFEVGTNIEASNIGSYNTFEIRSRVELGCQIKNGCVLGSLSTLAPGSEIEDYTCVFENGKLQKNLNFSEETVKSGIVVLYEALAHKMMKTAPTKK